MGPNSSESLNMKAMILASFLAAAALAAPDARFSCSECVDEMHKLGWMVKMGAVPIHDYVAANYCPTLGEDQGWCEEALSRYYVGMLFAIVEGLVMPLRSPPAPRASQALNGWRPT